MSAPRSTDAPGHASSATTVRRAGVADLERAARLFDAYRQFYGAASDLVTARRFLGARLARGESVVLLAIERGDGEPAAPASGSRAVGFAQLYPSFSSLQLAGIVILNDLFVAPERRGHGVGALLLDAALEHARGIGAARLELATEHENLVAQRLYASRGLVAESRFVHLGIDLERQRAAAVGPARS